MNGLLEAVLEVRAGEQYLEACPAHLEPTGPGVETQPPYLLWLIQTALERGEAPAHLQYIDDIIMWGNTAKKAFQKGEKIIQLFLKAG